MDQIIEYLPFLIPLVILELALLLSALIHLLKNRAVRYGNIAVWAVVICVLQIIGPVAYFVFGRKESEDDEGS